MGQKLMSLCIGIGLALAVGMVLYFSWQIVAPTLELAPINEVQKVGPTETLVPEPEPEPEPEASATPTPTTQPSTPNAETCWVFATATAEAEAEAEACWVNVPGGTLVREGPGTKYARTGTFKEGNNNIKAYCVRAQMVVKGSDIWCSFEPLELPLEIPGQYFWVGENPPQNVYPS